MSNPFRSSYYRGRLKFGAAVLIALLPSYLLFLLLNSGFGLEGRAAWYPCGGLFYTIAVFVNAYIDDRSILFSRKDGRSVVKLALVHMCFLTVFLLLFPVADILKPRLPHELLAEDRRGGSWALLLLVGAACIVFFVEESWLAATKRRNR
jgi:peptidoglycan/LPS O-acetylase OafA/YrhL